MLCPECRIKIDFSRPDCRGCGVDLLGAFEERAAAAERLRTRPRPVGPKSSRPARPRALAGLGIALAAALAWLGWRPNGATPAAPRFTYDPPPGWLIEEPGPGPGTWTEVLRLGRGAAVLQVLAGGLSPVAMRTAVSFAEESFQATEVRVERTHDLRVGGRPAWGMLVTGKRAMGKAGEGPGLGPFKGHAVVVPEGRAHLIQLFSEPAEFQRRDAELRRFLDGVRFQ